MPDQKDWAGELNISNICNDIVMLVGKLSVYNNFIWESSVSLAFVQIFQHSSYFHTNRAYDLEFLDVAGESSVI